MFRHKNLLLHFAAWNGDAVVTAWLHAAVAAVAVAPIPDPMKYETPDPAIVDRAVQLFELAAECA